VHQAASDQDATCTAQDSAKHGQQTYQIRAGVPLQGLALALLAIVALGTLFRNGRLPWALLIGSLLLAASAACWWLPASARQRVASVNGRLPLQERDPCRVLPTVFDLRTCGWLYVAGAGRPASAASRKRHGAAAPTTSRRDASASSHRLHRGPEQVRCASRRQGKQGRVSRQGLKLGRACCQALW